MPLVGNAKHLHVKSFFAATVKEALEQGHAELGPDALLVNAREAPPEARHLGLCEVVLGVGPTNDAEEKPEPHSRVEEALVEAGLPHEMAREIDQAVRLSPNRGPVVQMSPSSVASRWNTGNLASSAATALAGRLKVCPGLGRVTALVGPPGSGKTTTLVKLAVVEGLRAGRSTRLISADTQRIGGSEQLRTFASILGVSFQAVESVSALAQAIDGNSSYDLVLIDAPGYGKVLQQELGGDLAAFLSCRQDIDTHLVLTASTQPAVLRKLVERHRAYGPSKLLFTRLDEADSLAALYSEAVQQQMPLSYFGLGQLIPEDIEVATKERVTESLVRQLPENLQAVA